MELEGSNRDFTNSEYFRYMVDNIAEIENELKVFNDEFLKMFSSPTDEMAVVLKCHLIVEYYIDRYIEVAFPGITNPEQLNLRFAQKIQIVNLPGTMFSYYSDSISELNRLRNKFAHNLKYTLLTSDYQKMTQIMNAWYDALGNPRKIGIHLIGDFVLWYCGSTQSTINSIKRESPLTGISGYQVFLKEMQDRSET